MSQEAFNQTFFRLPEGGRLVRCIFTTMSMDLETLIRMSVMCGWPGRERAKASLYTLPYDRLRFFYDGNDVTNLRSEPKTDLSFRMLAVPVRGDFTCFHPKIILLEYRAQGSGASQFRLLISSRNLTRAESFETGVWLESVHREAGTPNHNLPELIRFLKAHTQGQADFLDGLEKQLEGVSFALMGEEDTTRVHVKVSGPKGLGRQDALVRQLLAGNSFRKNDSMVILSPDYETSPDAAGKLFLVQPVDSEDSGKPIATHGKLYYHKDSKTLWIGSANCSVAGLTENVECVAEIRDAEGVWEERNNRAGALFGQPCVRYTETAALDPGPLMKALKDFLNTHKICLAEGKTKDGKRTVKVTVSPKPSVPSDLTIELLPLGMEETTKLGGETKWQTLAESVKFTGSKQEQAAYALRLRATGGAGQKEVTYWGDIPESFRREREEESFRDFIDCPWLRRYYAESERGPEAVRQLCGEIRMQAERLAEKYRSDAAKLNRIEQIKCAAGLYCEYFCQGRACNGSDGVSEKGS